MMLMGNGNQNLAIFKFNYILANVGLIFIIQTNSRRGWVGNKLMNGKRSYNSV